MDVSGGRGRPRSGNDESAEHTGPRAQGPDDAPHEADDRSTTADRSADERADRRPGGPPDGTPAPDGPAAGRTPAAAGTGGEGDGGDAHTASADQDPAPVPAESEPRPAPGAGGHGAPDAGAPAPRVTREGASGDGHPAATPEPQHADRTLARSGAEKAPAPQRPQEKQRGLLMGRPFGVPVYVAPSWFLVALLITWVFGGQIDRVLPELGAASYLVSLFFAVAFYASVLVHELAHTLAALRFELPVRRIQLQFFGGVSEIEKEAETPGREFVLAFVGPLLSLVLSGLFYLALLAVDPGSVPGVLLAGLMISNLIVAVFNLLPGLPLDGGRMLRAVVWKLSGKPMTGTIAAAWVGRALAISVLIGLPLLTQSGALGSDAVDNVGMDTVLDALLAAILAAIIWTGAGNSLRMARLREHLPELRARALTRRAVPVETDTPLSEALRRANAAGARALVVVDADGAPLSLVREAAIVGVPEHRRPWVPVGGLAQDLTDGMRVSAELAGEELLDALRATPATEYLVVEETGEIYGVLSAADVERAFVKAMARPS
ncbi:site-2 protease family protein [Streptomyces sp. Tu 3180]|uniref:site-2 protease family protein n=1 Tax=Streptomyces sp. Tu 3180 TaxID=2682611 RepID=UPI00135AB144|nr:site-2 protease family protein [Streptomyces sp. Tu 3180]KAF3464491.1 peptidase [Streptomyces sp. Tu 3180]